MELALVIVVSASVLAASAWWWRRPRPVPVAPVSPDAFRAVVLAALVAAGIKVGSLQPDMVVLVNGRALRLQPLWVRYVGAAGPEARERAIRRQLEHWSAASEILTLADFRADLLRAFANAGVPAEPHATNPDLLQIGEQVVHLPPLHEKFQLLPPVEIPLTLEATAERYRKRGEIPASWETAAPMLLPRVVRGSVADLEAHREHLHTVLQIGPALVVTVTVTRSEVHNWLEEHLARWGVSFGDALIRGMENLAATGLPVHACAEAPGALLSKHRDHRDACAFLLPDEAVAKLTIRGRLVVFAIEDALVYLAGDEDDDALALCVAEAREDFAGVLHPAPLVRTGPVKWERFRPAAGHPLRAEIDRLHARQAASEVRATREILQREIDDHNRARDREILLARFPPAMVGELEVPTDGPPRTRAVWPAGDAVFPEADEIVVMDAEGASICAPFADVRELAGPILCRVEGLVTPWWFAYEAFPADLFADLSSRCGSAPVPPAGDRAGGGAAALAAFRARESALEADRFWYVIEHSRRVAGELDAGFTGRQRDALWDMLTRFTSEEIVSFDRTLAALHAEACRWDLWAAAYILLGGCSDDCFSDFRRWLISMGPTVYRDALRDPETLARVAGEVDVLESCFDDLPYLAGEARVDGDEERPADRAEPAGRPWEEHELPRLYPALWAVRR